MSVKAYIPKALSNWTPDERMEWEERAAILEYDEGLPRDKAEELAYWQIRRKREKRA